MGPKKAAKSSDIHEMSGESVALRAASLMKSLHVLLITLQILDLLAAPSSGQTYRRQSEYEFAAASRKCMNANGCD